MFRGIKIFRNISRTYLVKLIRQLDYYGSSTTYYQDRLYLQFVSRLLDLISKMVASYMMKHVTLHFTKYYNLFNPLSTNFTKWWNTLKQFVDKLPTNCLSVFDHFVGLALKGLIQHRIGYNGHYKMDILRETIQWARFGNTWKNKLVQETVTFLRYSTPMSKVTIQYYFYFCEYIQHKKY